MSGDELLAEIEQIDAELVALLKSRAEKARALVREDPARARTALSLEADAALHRRVEQLGATNGDATLPPDALHAVFREIASGCRVLFETPRVAYFGPRGTFTHLAACRTFGASADFVEALTIPGVFRLVERGDATSGVVPIENSTEGGVNVTLDCLLESRLQVQGEAVLEIVLCLVSRERDLPTITSVYSHPQPLAQCRAWLSEHLQHAAVHEATSTSAAAALAASTPGAAAIASELSAELHGLSVLRRGVQDRSQNATRFVVIGERDARPTGRDRTSLFFATRHERGALKLILEVFDQEGINLSRIESRPGRQKLWEYVFYMDLEGHRLDPPVARALMRVEQACGMVKVLGSYPRAH